MGMKLESVGRLWAKGHETFSAATRRILSVTGKGAQTYLQGLITCDLTESPPDFRSRFNPKFTYRRSNATDAESDSSYQESTVPKPSDTLRSACFIDQRGRAVSDAMLWKFDNDFYYIDVAAGAADALLTHLQNYKIGRSSRKVKVEDATPTVSSHVIYGTMNCDDPPPGYLMVSGVDCKPGLHQSRITSMQDDDFFRANLVLACLCRTTQINHSDDASFAVPFFPVHRPEAPIAWNSIVVRRFS